MTIDQVMTAFFWAITLCGVAIVPLGVWMTHEAVWELRRAKASAAFEPFAREVSERLHLPEEQVGAALRDAQRARKVTLTPGP